MCAQFLKTGKARWHESKPRGNKNGHATGNEGGCLGESTPRALELEEICNKERGGVEWPADACRRKIRWMRKMGEAQSGTCQRPEKSPLQDPLLFQLVRRLFMWCLMANAIVPGLYQDVILHSTPTFILHSTVRFLSPSCYGYDVPQSKQNKQKILKDWTISG